jgi:diaminopimelate decarboxylase
VTANAATDARLLARAHAALNARASGTRAFWFYDLDAIGARAARMQEALKPLRPRLHYALKANGLPAIARVLKGERPRRGRRVRSANWSWRAPARSRPAGARSRATAARPKKRRGWHGTAWRPVSADFPGELDLLESEAARGGVRLRVALRVNPGIVAGGHRHIETGHAATKFGMSAREALEAWRAAARWPHLHLDGVHVHVGSQVAGVEPFVTSATLALELAAECAGAGHTIESVNLGGGFAVDYEGDGPRTRPGRTRGRHSPRCRARCACGGASSPAARWSQPRERSWPKCSGTSAATTTARSIDSSCWPSG